jgi:histidinol-phosphatase
MRDLLTRTARSRGFGDFYQHMLVAEGAGDMAIDPGVHPWDVAAIQVIVEEAGGMATTMSGRRDIYGGSLVTSNGLLHQEVLDLLGGEQSGSREVGSRK